MISILSEKEKSKIANKRISSINSVHSAVVKGFSLFQYSNLSALFHKVTHSSKILILTETHKVQAEV